MATMTNNSPSIEGELLEKTKRKHGHVVDEEDNGKIITNPTEKDILLGRSSMAKRHAGNLFYRDLVEKNQVSFFCKLYGFICICMGVGEDADISNLLDFGLIVCRWDILEILHLYAVQMRRIFSNQNRID